MQQELNQINIYTDGACNGNPGKGGFGIVMEWRGKDYVKEFSEGYLLTTNNRMELLAVITALNLVKKENVDITIFSDSKYVVDAVNENWIEKWERRYFNKVKNPDLWKRFIPLYKKYKPKMVWIKGHNGHPQNEKCDRMAVAASLSETLFEDKGYLPEQGLF